ncbi:condensation domain-containing protein [Williamsia maris]|uniref:Condensation domain-containing protein n=1 Tax=Williamsia maris TaxID=72806 RepID=A0ABT1HBN2_9NOCA|nr:condensation domain-containing protein [Williamsia maris]MCP2174286.1 Condensation domain-containing protein [Williamsia maris]
MKLTTFANLDVPAGRLHRWATTASGVAVRHATGPSENERFHLDAVADGASGWLAVTFDIDSPAPDLVAVQHAFETVLDHHEVLRAHFVTDDDGDVRRLLHAPGGLTVSAAETVEHVDAATCKELISSTIVDGCTALSPASHVLAALEHGDTTTIICAFDHCYVDAHSLAVIAEDLTDAYRGEALRPAGSFLEHQAAEACGELSDSDARIVGWNDFLSATDWHVPEFPIDLGVAEGEFAAARIHVETVLSAEDAATFSASAAERGIRFYPALLACLALATRDLGGPEKLPLILPVHTRRTDTWSRSVGWFVANAPLVLDASNDLVSAMRSATDALAAALPLAEVDLTTVYGTFGHRLRKTRHDVFMVSYLDYRRFDGLPTMNVHHVSSDGRADTLQLWFWRDENGVHLRARFPDTETAATVVHTLVDDLIRIATDQLRHGHASLLTSPV